MLKIGESGLIPDLHCPDCATAYFAGADLSDSDKSYAVWIREQQFTEENEGFSVKMVARLRSSDLHHTR